MITRIKPIRDAFTVGSVGLKNTGLDEVLEIGHSDLLDSEGSSRIVMTFRAKKPENYSEQKHRAVLRLFEVRSENLPATCSVELCSYGKKWVEGTGHISDEPYTQDGLLAVDIAALHPLGSIDFVTGLGKQDIVVDVTDIIDKQPSEFEITFVLKLADESLADSMHTRLMYYSKDTHTCFWPFIDLEQDDSVYNSDFNTIQNGPIRLTLQGLVQEVVKGSNFRVDVLPSHVYPKRVFSTSSLYREQLVLPQGYTYGIRDLYTGEMVIDPVGNLGTLVNSDNSGNFIMLQTEMLEPERYYNIEFYGDGRLNKQLYIIPKRNIFRVRAPWRQ